MVVLTVVASWLFLLVLALALLRTAGAADRATEERVRRLTARQPRPAHAETRRRATTTVAVMAAALPLAAAAGAADASARVADPRCGGSGPPLTLCLINAERQARGLAALAADARLARAAQRHAADMVERRYFSHDSPTGSSLVDRLRRVGYATRCAWSGGETLAWGAGARRTPASRVAAWMRSAPHRQILLSPAFRDAGVGIASGVPDGSRRGLTYAAGFGRKRC